MKVIAMYLPQFHRVPENDAWWGEGFTDWKSAQYATPLFEGHYQPHVPLNRNYYDLMEKETMQWQADLMHQYGVDGMCMYHYWFKDGRQILEKPVENLLKWDDIDMPFCLCWANETWARSWSNIVGTNVWSNKFETGNKETDKAILLEQKYGEKEQWKEHFDYLLPFFKDDRYIKLEGKPVFLIYEAGKVSCLGEMLTYWRELALENGIEGIYVIGSDCRRDNYQVLDAVYKNPPRSALKRITELIPDRQGVKKISYDTIWDAILTDSVEEIKTYFGGLVSYDDTPRRIKNGLVIEGASPESFESYLAKLIAKNTLYENEFVLVNAWNEWGEGMHLEPDERYGYRYLEAVNNAKNTKLDDFFVQETAVAPNQEELYKYQKLWEKSEGNMQLFDVWMRLRENGISLETMLLELDVS